MTITSTPRKRLLCRLGMHKYVLRYNEGQRYHECKYCRHFDPRSSSTGGGNGYVIG